MKVKLSLQEKLRDLREERKLKLSDIEDATGIPKSTLQRFEDEKNTRIGYQDIEVLTRFYEVSADYLFGVTDLRQYRNVDIDKLGLSDEAIEILISKRLNSRLLSEMITHPDFSELLAGLEVYIDRTISPTLEVINQTFKVAVDVKKRQQITEGLDEYIAGLKEVQINGDDYLRFRLSRKFEEIARGLYDAHSKETQSQQAVSYLSMFEEHVQTFQDAKDETGSSEEAKLATIADQWGVNLKKAPDEEKQSVMSFLSRSKFAQFFRKRK